MLRLCCGYVAAMLRLARYVAPMLRLANAVSPLHSTRGGISLAQSQDRERQHKRLLQHPLLQSLFCNLSSRISLLESYIYTTAQETSATPSSAISLLESLFYRAISRREHKRLLQHSHLESLGKLSSARNFWKTLF